MFILNLILNLIIVATFQMSPDSPVKVVLDARATLGEGALWHPVENKLYWVDIEGRVLHIFDPESGKDVTFPTGERVGTVVPIAGGGALVALQNGIHKINTGTGDMTLITDPIKNPEIRFNDGKCDPAGRFWVGTMALDSEKGAAVLYRMDADQRVHQMLDNVTVSNGIAWSADKKTMYYVDTPTATVRAFDYDNETGAISNGRVVIRVAEGEGFPDGMTIDAEGKLWIAMWGGSGVARYDPLTGQLMEKIDVPAPHTTSCAFGGKNLETLYITTARTGLGEETLEKFPHSGALFAVKPGVKGVPAEFYKGNL